MHTADSIASRTSIPRGYLAKILQRLHQHQLLGTQRGLGGGYALRREPSQITVLDVVRAIDPREGLSRCGHCEGDACSIIAYLTMCADTCDTMLGKTRLSSFLTSCTTGPSGT